MYIQSTTFPHLFQSCLLQVQAFQNCIPFNKKQKAKQGFSIKKSNQKMHLKFDALRLVLLVYISPVASPFVSNDGEQGENLVLFNYD